MSNPKIYLSSPHMGEKEFEFVKEAFDTNWISPVGPHIAAFESELAAYNQIEHCAALSSGTAAIHLALIILGVEQGDEVICSTFTFSGTCNPIAYQKAIPVFVDSESETWNLDPQLLEETILDRIKKTSKKPKAIIAVHLYGMPAKMDEIMEVAKRYDIPVIEDAAEALGSTLNGKKLGTFGDLGVFSFNGNKIITTSGGGALVSSNEAWIKQARFLATQARDPAPHYEHTQIGYNYRLSNVSAAIGRGQLMVLEERIKARRKNFLQYEQALFNKLGVAFLKEPVNYFSNRWLTTMLLDPLKSKMKTDQLRVLLESANIEARPLWKPMHLQPVFKSYPSYRNGVSERLFQQGICLPSGSNLTSSEMTTILEILNSCL
jgi:dTDP-4-amino-4,6-dideoxygalactose transaminase